MDFLRGNIRTLYFRYLSAAFGSALIASIYAIVDMAMVGQYHGPAGSAALAVVAPIWNIIYSLGLLTGIGGSVLFSMLRGQNGNDTRPSNEYFTVSLLLSAALGVAVWVAVAFFDEPLLTFFGAQGEILALARTYVQPVKFVAPVFLFNQMLAAYLRNDKNPMLATVSVLSGGIFNIFGDFYFVFGLDMGAFGAGLATALGSVISLLVMLPHFFLRRNTLRIVRPTRLWQKSCQVCTAGFSAFFVDVAMGLLTILFNRQIMALLGSDALAVYGVIVNISTFVQCCAYSIGQAAQPIVSTNFGAGAQGRIRQTLVYALGTAAFFGIFWTALSMAIPNGLIRLFMQPTQSVLAIAPSIVRRYALSFLLLPLNIFSTYYFQAIMRPRAAFVVSVGRGFVLSGLLILLLPRLAGADAIWYAMPITEAIVVAYVVYAMTVFTRNPHPISERSHLA